MVERVHALLYESVNLQKQEELQGSLNGSVELSWDRYFEEEGLGATSEPASAAQEEQSGQGVEVGTGVDKGPKARGHA